MRNGITDGARIEKPIKIKICGLKRFEDVGFVNAVKPDYVGFVFAGSKRKIDFDTAKKLKSELSKDILAVGVFVNEEIEYITRLVSEHVIDIIQLHGDEDEEYIEALKKQIENHGGNTKKSITIIKAIRVKTPEQVLKTAKINVNYLLLDAFRKDAYGGCGVVFDHSLIPKLDKPYFLAGGISSDNVIGILADLKGKGKLPYCIDVSSSVETDGFKDFAKIKEIVKMVHEFH